MNVSVCISLRFTSAVFQAIQSAYETLSDERQRREYDRKLDVLRTAKPPARPSATSSNTASSTGATGQPAGERRTSNAQQTPYPGSFGFRAQSASRQPPPPVAKVTVAYTLVVACGCAVQVCLCESMRTGGQTVIQSTQRRLHTEMAVRECIWWSSQLEWWWA